MSYTQLCVNIIRTKTYSKYKNSNNPISHPFILMNNLRPYLCSVLYELQLLTKVDAVLYHGMLDAGFVARGKLNKDKDLG